MNTIVDKIRRRIARLNKKKWRKSYDEMLQQSNVEEKFKQIYEKNLWRNVESVSGSGSTLKFTKNLREALPLIVSQYSVTNIFDAPCGDLNWMKHALKKMKVSYTGGDIVESLIEKNKEAYSKDNIEFITINLIEEPFPATDMMLCRDCLFHMSYRDTLSILTNFIDSNTKYLFTTTYKKPHSFVNEDIVTGSYRAIDLTKAPYNFPVDAIYSIMDGKKDNIERFMCLWKREQILPAVEAMSKSLPVQ